jgi:hypothetical protein
MTMGSIMHKLLNVKELAAICAKIKPCSGHKKLLSALSDHYPDFSFNLVSYQGIWHRDGRLLDSKGHLIANSYQDWLAKAITANGDNAYETWRQYKNEGYVTTEVERPTLYITAQYSSSPDAFYQIEVDMVREVWTRPLFSSTAPANLSELKSFGFSEQVKIKAPTPRHYELYSLTNIRTFVRDMYEEKCGRTRQVQRDATSYELSLGNASPYISRIRIFSDWHESSAGKNNHFCRHWALGLNDSSASTDGESGFLLYDADVDGSMKLLMIDPAKFRSVSEFMNRLQEFDSQAGYPFAWYFHMLKGYPINHRIGETVAKGVRCGMIRLPEHDERVLLRWDDCQYSFN